MGSCPVKGTPEEDPHDPTNNPRLLALLSTVANTRKRMPPSHLEVQTLVNLSKGLTLEPSVLLPIQIHNYKALQGMITPA